MDLLPAVETSDKGDSEDDDNGSAEDTAADGGQQSGQEKGRPSPGKSDAGNSSDESVPSKSEEHRQGASRVDRSEKAIGEDEDEDAGDEVAGPKNVRQGSEDEDTESEKETVDVGQENASPEAPRRPSPGLTSVFFSFQYTLKTHVQFSNMWTSNKFRTNTLRQLRKKTATSQLYPSRGRCCEEEEESYCRRRPRRQFAWCVFSFQYTLKTHVQFSNMLKSNKFHTNTLRPNE
jgi:hypothetical protein